MLHSKHGQRYLSEQEFEGYCSELNIPLRESTEIGDKHSEGDLERFERYGLLLPVLRKVFPGEYTAAIMQQIRDKTGLRVLDDPRWEDMRPLEEHPYTEPEDMTEAQLWHYLDREQDRGNPHLSKPDGSIFTPWVSRPRHSAYGPTTYEDSTVRFYHYWQAYQAYLIQKHYRLFAFHPNILKRSIDRAENDRERANLERQLPKPSDPWMTLAHANSLFEPLSLYIWLRTKEAERSYARAETGEGFMSLSGTALTDYDDRVVGHARTVQQKYALTAAQLVEFAAKLIDFQRKLVKDERTKLASELESDLWYLREFMLAVTGKTADELGVDLDRQGVRGTGEKFRYLDKVVEVTEEAAADWNLSVAEYNKVFPDQQISESEIRELVDFLSENGMFIVPYTVHDGREFLGERRDFYELTRYVWMKNLSTGLEDFLRVLYGLGLNSSNPPSVLPRGPKTLKNIIGALFTWQSAFDSMCARIENETARHGVDPADEAIYNIYDAHTNVALDNAPHLRAFLVSYWTRNLTSHRHPFTNTLSHNLLYGQLGGHVFGAIFYCFFYAWKYAKQQGWVK